MYKAIIRKWKSLSITDKPFNFWHILTLSEKSLIISTLTMSLLFVASFNIYVRTKIKATREKSIEVVVEEKETVPNKEEKNTNLAETKPSSKGVDIQSHQAFDLAEEVKQGELDEGELSDIDEAIGENLDIKYPSVNDNKEELEEILLRSKNKINQTQKVISSYGEKLKRIRNNKDKSTIKYNLPGRKIIYASTPAYTCLKGGTIVVDIEISSLGRVTDAKINDTESTSSDGCLRDNAIKYAKEAIFDNSEKLSLEKGTITFTYIPK